MRYIAEINQVTFIEPFKIYKDCETFIIKFNNTNREFKCNSKTFEIMSTRNMTLHEKLIIEHVFQLNEKEFKRISNTDCEENFVSLPSYVDYTDSMVLFDLEEIVVNHRACKQQQEMEQKHLQQISENKVKLEGEEYQVLLHDNTDFETAFETLNYVFEKYTENQKSQMMTTIEDDYKTIFKKDNHRKIHIYEDKNEVDSRRREFVKNILENHPSSHVHIFLCVPLNIAANNLHTRTSDIMGNDINKYTNMDIYSKYSIRVITDTTIDKISTRIVIGA